MNERVRTGIHVVRTVASIFPYLNLERKSKAYWTSSRRAAETSGRMQAGTEASRYNGGSGRMMLGLSGVQKVWHIIRTDGTVDRRASGRDDTSSGRLAGNRLF
jgi:alanine dehydrogenase